MFVSELITAELLDFLKSNYHLNWEQGLHGVHHWERVRENGLRLARLNGANPRVVEVFAFTHDIQRMNDGSDYGHGRRASEFIRARLTGKLALTPPEIDLLCIACEGHTQGHCHADLTICTCWDADRLDLMRANIRPDPRHLCTLEAKDPEIIEWAIQRSLAGRRG